jgi:hypothetical protein
MDKVEKYLIYKKGTQDVECIANVSQGNNNETVLLNIDNNFNKAVKFNSLEEALKAINIKKEFWNKYNGNCALYFYDNKTTPDDLGILKVTLEELL